jgi:DNA-binding transcriptional LysR family regulator
VAITYPRGTLDLPLNQLRTFLKVARLLSFTRAAAELDLTQPAVSAHVRKLERAIGEALFEQIGRRVSLTPTGEIVYRYAEQVLGLEDELRVALADAQTVCQGVLAIGTSTTIGISVLPELLRRYRQAHPLVRLQVRIGNFPEVAHGLLDGMLDVGLISGDRIDDERLVAVPCLDDTLVLVVEPGHRWADLPSVRPEDLGSEPLILPSAGSQLRARIAEAITPFELSIDALDAVAESNSLIALGRMVGAGLGVGIVPRLAVADDLAQGRLREVPIQGLEIHRPVCLLIHRDKHRTPALRAFQTLLMPVGTRP